MPDQTEYQLAELVAMTRELGDVKAERDRLREVVAELIESAEYWSEYDVPLGIVERMKQALGG